MASLDNIRNNLIDKLMAIRNKEFLAALDKIVDTAKNVDAAVELSAAQKTMLQMSEEDIKHGRVITQEELDNEDLKWLKEL